MIRFYFRWSPRTVQRAKAVLLLMVIILLITLVIQGVLIPRGLEDRGGTIATNEQPKKGIYLIKNSLVSMGIETQVYKKMLASTLPFIEASQGFKKDGYLVAAMQTVLDVDPRNPRSFFGQGMTALGTMEVLAATSMESYPLYEDEAIVETPDFNFEETGDIVQNNPVKTEKISEGAEVIILNTHNAENYKGNGGVSKKEGENAGVAKVAAQLEKLLKEKYQITIARSETIHDYPKFEESYGNSAVTMGKLIRENPYAQIVIDIHRDAGHKKPLTAIINGKKCAQIRLIVGSDARLPHPDWMQNREFARQVTEKMDEMYPGLSLGYRVQSGRYNQHLHPHGILIELGNDLNSLDEAYQGIELFAAVLNELLKNN